MGETISQQPAALKLITDLDGEPVILDDNPAHIEGALNQAALYFKRTGQYAALFEQGAKVLSNGKLAIDSASAILFFDDTYTIPGKAAYDFCDPCPPTSERIREYNVYAEEQTILGTATWDQRPDIRKRTQSRDTLLRRSQTDTAQRETARAIAPKGGGGPHDDKSGSAATAARESGTWCTVLIAVLEYAVLEY